MNSASFLRAPLALACVLLIAACSGTSDSASTTTAISAEVDTEVDADSDAVAEVEDTSTTEDNRTAEEIAIDRLDLLMYDLGVTDLEGTSNCVVERLESENIELTGESTSELIALFGCDENAITQWLPPTNGALPDETWSCTVGSIADWINELTIPDAEAFFESAAPPSEFIDSTATRCDVSADELTAAF